MIASRSMTHSADRNMPPCSPRLPSCENCRASSWELRLFRVSEASVFWQCKKCGLYQKGLPVPSDHYVLDYHAHYLRANERKLSTARDRVGQVLPLTQCPAPRLLDVGCSIGATLLAASELGCRSYGVDVSLDAVKWCRDQGLRCQHYDGIQLPFPSKFFDVVTAWHVIEHVPCVRTSLAEWFRVLRPGGVLAIETPSANCWKARILGAKYQKFWPAEHTYAFTDRTLKSFVWDAGFDVVPPPRSPLPWSTRWSLRAIARRWQLQLARSIGASKSFVVFARRPSGQPLQLTVGRFF